MKKDWLSYGLVIVGILSLAVIGCRSVLDRVTPAEIPSCAAFYVGDMNFAGVRSLKDARDIRGDIIIMHRGIQLDLLRLAKDDEYAYKDALGFIEQSIEESENLQDLVIGSEDQPISILGLLAGAGIAFPAGKLMKRKGDYSPEEFEAAVAKIKTGNSSKDTKADAAA